MPCAFTEVTFDVVRRMLRRWRAGLGREGCAAQEGSMVSRSRATPPAAGLATSERPEHIVSETLQPHTAPGIP